MIQQIISDLTNDDKSLVSSLLKTKVFASRIKNKKLLEWVNREINGYSTNDSLPEYRIGSATSSCTLRQGYAVQENTPVPISFIDNEKMRNFFVEFEFRDSVKTLESYLSNKDNDTIMKVLPIDFWAVLTRAMRESGFKGEIRDIKKMSHISTITQTLTEIRSEFLDLMLKLESEYPNLPSNFEEISEDIKDDITNTVNIIMGNQYSITNTGNSNTINTGNDAKINTATGTNINQEIETSSLKKEEIKKLAEQIKNIVDKIQLKQDDKEDIIDETDRILTQIKRENPKKNIISQSLNTTYDILSKTDSNPITEPIITEIETLLSNF
ncbi:hypothetical protein [Pseudotamlana carrageenivorans]|uniref:AbiTii domain-containing protein n=1 Tax=Pseudotamlana carrageenivorans TaxID=2069432 RepID=A0A2I7SLX1_9FLAO|nr:hypothetical protein [Tamlana carrageenivorans]AUS06854.1 hypothetical protein C1A40_16010 [Tamlana carrageenivorans]